MSDLKSSEIILKTLVEKGYMTRQEFFDYTEGQTITGVSLLESMVNDNVLPAKNMAVVLAGMFDMEFVDLSDYRTDLKKWGMPVEMMYKNSFIPVALDESIMTVAVSDPRELVFLEDLGRITGKTIKYCVGSKGDIFNSLKRSEGSSQLLNNIGKDFRGELGEVDEDEVIELESLADDESPVVRLVNSIIINALQKRTSDIHIESTSSGVTIKYRVDGVLHNAMESIDPSYQEPLISRIKVMSQLDIAERMVPQDGRFKLKVEGKKIDFRVSVLPSIYGEDVVIRVLDKEYLAKEEGYDQLSLDTLGFAKEDLGRFKKAIREPYGMVLVTGPTGSGKTTSLYSAISEINTSQDKVITIEDPVEYHIADIVQIPVNEKKGLTFAKGLRSILRHDPDKIMIGEIRDKETASIAIQSALTGHLVFTTVHANNAFDVIGRFINLGIEPYNFVSSLNCILAQRLVRKICSSCKREVTIGESVFEEFNISIGDSLPIVYEGIGCVKCNGTGFLGREAITEFLDLSDTIKDMILDKKTASEIRKQAVAEGLTTLRESAVNKFLDGVSTLAEINRVTFVE